jgi:integrase
MIRSVDPISLFHQKKDIALCHLYQNSHDNSIKCLDKIGMEALFSMAKGRDRLILLCLFDLGCRVGELVTARFYDIDFQNRFIRI